MKLSVVIILTIFVAFSVSLKYEKDKKNCNCVYLEHCPVLISKLKELHFFQSQHYLFTEYLHAINCGYIWDTPMVCCPKSIPSAINDSILSEGEISNSKEKDKLNKVRCDIPKLKMPPLSSGILGIKPTKSPEKKENKNKSFECGRDMNRDRHLFGNKTDLSDFPWMALLEYDTLNGTEFLCGGVLISDQYILTAAHCVTSLSNRLSSVVLGEHDTSTKIDCLSDGNDENTFTCSNDTIKFGIDQVFVHDDYNDGISHRDDDVENGDLHDIALIKLRGKVVFTDYIQPICLPEHTPKRTKFSIAGWGKSFIPEAKGFNRKLTSSLTRINQETCMNNPRLNFVTNEHICAGLPVKREQPCIADSGGPLMSQEKKKDGSIRFTVFGISYMDMSCARPDLTGNLPGVFTSVHKYKQWIRKHIQSD